MKLGKDIAAAKYCLINNDLAAIPTETVYGLAANGFSPEAVVKIYEAKNRPSFNPLILHVGTMQQAERLVSTFPEKARRLAEAFWPGPLTLVLPKSKLVPDIVTAGQSSVAIRIPNHPLTLELLQSLDFPLAAPSANPSGYVSPTSPQHVAEQLGEKVCYILDGGECTVGVESTIVKVVNDEVTVLRVGGLELEKIVELIGALKLHTHEENAPLAPGMTRSHYAPRKKVIIGDIKENLKQYPYDQVAVLSLKTYFSEVPAGNQLMLSPTGNLAEAARNIFSYLRLLDGLDVQIILTELVPDEGLGKAVNDRLKRAGA